MDWSTLEPDILGNILSNLSFDELKILTSVCHNWNDEIGFLWRDKLELDFQHFYKDRSCLQSNIEVLKKSKRIYANLKIANNGFFEDAKTVFEAIPLQKNVKSLELKGFSMSQIEYIFSWMGKSLEKLSISEMPKQQTNTTASQTDDQYFTIFANLRVLSMKRVSFEVQKFFKYFVNVTVLMLHDVTLQQFKESLEFCTKVEKLYLSSIKARGIEKSDFNIFQSLKHLREIVIDGVSSQEFTYMFCEVLGDPKVKHVFPLKVFHLQSILVKREIVSKLIYNFQNLEDIYIFKEKDSTILHSVWSLKGLKVLRGNICNAYELKGLDPFELAPHFSLTTIDISGTRRSNVDCDIVNTLLQNMPNLESLSLSNFEICISLVFGPLSALKNFKTLKLESVFDISSAKPEFTCLRTLEDLEIHYCNTKNYTLELPSLKRITLGEKTLSDKWLQSIINTSRNLEFIHIKSVFNFKIMEPLVSKIMNLRNLKVIFLNFIRDENIFQTAKYFLIRSNYKIQRINIDYTEATDKTEIDKGITEISKLVDKASLVLDDEYHCEYLFIKKGTKVKLQLRKQKIKYDLE